MLFKTVNFSLPEVESLVNHKKSHSFNKLDTKFAGRKIKQKLPGFWNYI
jgi:hypothetical protein